jgi:hypothetical protein
MTDHLSGVRAKLQRAYKHFSELDKVRQRWVNTDAGEIVHENHPEAREYLVICKRAPVPPPEMSVIVGEIVHGLRSSLDNLIYALAIRESKQGPPPFWKRLEFPIYKDEADFNNQWQKRLSIFSQGARTLIKDLQPFNEHPLDLSRNGLWIMPLMVVLRCKYRLILPLR